MSTTREYVLVNVETDEVIKRCHACNRAQAARTLNHGKEHGNIHATSEACYSLESRRDYDRRAKYAGAN